VVVDDNLKVVCKYCGLHLSTKSGISSLRTHISEYCPTIHDASRDEFIYINHEEIALGKLCV